MADDLAQNNITKRGYLAAIIALIIVPTLLVSLRVIHNCRARIGSIIEDSLSILALMLLSSYSALSYMALFSTNGSTTSQTFTRNVIIAETWLAGYGSWLAKAPILFLYVRLFGVHGWIRNISYITLCLSLLALTVDNICTTVKCSPNGPASTTDFMSECMDTTLRVGLANGATSLATDVVIFLIPIPVVVKIKLPLAKKMALAVVFLTGFFAIIASAISLYYRITSVEKVSYEVGQMLGRMVECSITIIISCGPALRSFYNSNKRSTEELPTASSRRYTRMNMPIIFRRASDTKVTDSSNCLISNSQGSVELQAMRAASVGPGC